MMDQTKAATAIQKQVRGRNSRLAIADKAKLAEHALAANDVAMAQKIMQEISSEGPNPTEKLSNEQPPPEDNGSRYAEVDRERLCCDILNTAVMAALVGGFALSNMTLLGDSTLDYLTYTLACFAVHACTCSCLTSALLYRVGIRMKDELVPQWAAEHKMLLFLPLSKFGMGCWAYLLSVIFRSFRDLAESSVFQYTCLIIGGMSMSTVVVTVMVIVAPDLWPKRTERRHTRVVPHGS